MLQRIPRLPIPFSPKSYNPKLRNHKTSFSTVNSSKTEVNPLHFLHRSTRKSTWPKKLFFHCLNQNFTAILNLETEKKNRHRKSLKIMQRKFENHRKWPLQPTFSKTICIFRTNNPKGLKPCQLVKQTKRNLSSPFLSKSVNRLLNNRPTSENFHYGPYRNTYSQFAQRLLDETSQNFDCRKTMLDGA